MSQHQPKILPCQPVPHAGPAAGNRHSRNRRLLNWGRRRDRGHLPLPGPHPARGHRQRPGQLAALVALGGFLLGAVLLIGAALPTLPTLHAGAMPVALVLNVVLGQLMGATGLPFYVDAIGTVLIAVLAGPAAGAATGALSTIVWSFFNPTVLPFAAGAALIGFLPAGRPRRAVPPLLPRTRGRLRHRHPRRRRLRPHRGLRLRRHRGPWHWSGGQRVPRHGRHPPRRHYQAGADLGPHGQGHRLRHRRPAGLRAAAAHHLPVRVRPPFRVLAGMSRASRPEPGPRTRAGSLSRKQQCLHPSPADVADGGRLHRGDHDGGRPLAAVRRGCPRGSTAGRRCRRRPPCARCGSCAPGAFGLVAADAARLFFPEGRTVLAPGGRPGSRRKDCPSPWRRAPGQAPACWCCCSSPSPSAPLTWSLRWPRGVCRRSGLRPGFRADAPAGHDRPARRHQGGAGGPRTGGRARAVSRLAAVRLQAVPLVLGLVEDAGVRAQALEARGFGTPGPSHQLPARSQDSPGQRGFRAAAVPVDRSGRCAPVIDHWRGPVAP